MKALELILKLQDLIAKHGDLLVIEAIEIREIEGVEFFGDYYYNDEEKDVFVIF